MAFYKVTFERIVITAERVVRRVERHDINSVHRWANLESDQFDRSCPDDVETIATACGEWVANDVTKIVLSASCSQPSAAPKGDGSYRPELAEAFRLGAVELQIDAIDVEPGALVEPAEGGAWVYCRVYVGDSERLPMAGEEEAQA